MTEFTAKANRAMGTIETAIKTLAAARCRDRFAYANKLLEESYHQIVDLLVIADDRDRSYYEGVCKIVLLLVNQTRKSMTYSLVDKSDSYYQDPKGTASPTEELIKVV